MYKKILAPLDGSELSECILGHVKAIAAGYNVPEVILLRVTESGQYAVGEPWARDAEKKADGAAMRKGDLNGF